MVGIFGRVLDPGRAGVAECDRNAGLDGFGIDPRFRKLLPTPFESGFLLAPDQSQRLHPFAHGGVAETERYAGSVVLELLGVPTHSDTQQQAPSGDDVHGGCRAGQIEQVVLEKETHPRAQDE